MKRNTIIELVCVLHILLFIYAAGSKLIFLNISYQEMNNQPFPNWMTPYLVWGISLLELSIAGLLLFDRTKKTGLWSSLFLMILFSGYIGTILLGFFERVPCSCGGIIKQLGWTNHFYFNLFFVASSILALILFRKQQKQDQYSETQSMAFS